MKIQSAVDFISSYGIALVIITIAVAAIYRIAYSNISFSGPICTPVPGFSCDFFSINKTGIFTMKISQVLGSKITVNGIACSSQANSTGDKPNYGNIQVTNSITYYPVGFAPNSNTIYTDGYGIFSMYCYDANGIAKYRTGSTFPGYVWLNYSIPAYGTRTQRIAVISAPYT